MTPSNCLSTASMILLVSCAGPAVSQVTEGSLPSLNELPFFTPMYDLPDSPELYLANRATNSLKDLPLESRRIIVNDLEDWNSNLYSSKKKLLSLPIWKQKIPGNARQIASLDSAIASNSNIQSFLLNDDPSPPDATKEFNQNFEYDYEPEYMPVLNPTLAMCGNGPWEPANFAYHGTMSTSRESLRNVGVSVGMLSRQWSSKANPGDFKYFDAGRGTAIAIGPDLILTPRHVVEQQVQNRSSESSEWILRAGERYIVDFPRQTDACVEPGTAYQFEVTQIVRIGAKGKGDEDIAVLRVKPLNGGVLVPVVFTPTPRIDVDARVAVVGYPGRPDPRNYIKPTGSGVFRDDLQMEAYFDLPNGKTPKYNIQRVGLGRLARINSEPSPIFGHDAPTDNASSGSAVVTLDNGAIVGMHIGGFEARGINVFYRSDHIYKMLKNWDILN